VEHLAGQDCALPLGYSGWQVSAEEMHFIREIQCLHPKDPAWKEECGDEVFERGAQYCFVTGISKQGANYYEVFDLEPVRHGVRDAFINNNTLDIEDMPGGDGSTFAMPFHSQCFRLFKKMSKVRQGKVDIDGLWLLREVCSS
jgi:hypothetical protein